MVTWEVSVGGNMGGECGWLHGEVSVGGYMGR